MSTVELPQPRGPCRVNPDGPWHCYHPDRNLDREYCCWCEANRPISEARKIKHGVFEHAHG